ncbi:MAG: GTP 3',8-cyclase MoaA [Candidatus Schekmanbacteria bacterium]|nr:GTP 3',8-cyclase MoaA [Candidatus Schekmanbacteria bacterium]
MKLIDSHGRSINYLRVSVTDRCNLRCIYCMKQGGLEQKEKAEILTFEEIERIVSSAVKLGISKVRLTGGEPLVRKGFISFVEKISKIPGIKDLSLTTNGSLLEDYAERLKSAGIMRVNVSLDSLKPKKYSEITYGGDIEKVFKGIEAARRVGLLPVKINVVVIKELNDDEIADFAMMTMKEDLNIRFIEYMPIGSTDLWNDSRYMPTDKMLEILNSLGTLEKIGSTGHGPAVYYRLKGAKGKIGLISPISNHFCSSCNKLRLTSDGRLRKCLFSDDEVDVRTVLRIANGNSEEELEKLLLHAVQSKPEKLNLDALGRPIARAMSEIGG